jgi:trehalose utilization protein
MANTGIVRALVWDENPRHAPKKLYPESLRGAVAGGLAKFGDGQIEARTAHLDEPEQGITEARLAETDVLIWWGHARHGEVNETTVARVKNRVHNDGMGFIALHSGHYSKTLQAVTGGPGHLKGGWREMNPMEPEQIRVCAPWHPIAKGIEDFTIEHEEMYGAPFEVPPPLVLVFQSYFPYDGKTFPTGICWTVGKGIDPGFTSGPGGGKGQGEGVGRVFYFRPGHETVPTYFNETVQKIITNAALWCAHRS